MRNPGLRISTLVERLRACAAYPVQRALSTLGVWESGRIRGRWYTAFSASFGQRCILRDASAMRWL